MRIGSLFSGAGGLDMAVESVFGGHVVWQCEFNEAASKVLAHRYPGVQNFGEGRNQRGDETCLPGALLPTPSVADGEGGHLTRSGDRSNELLLPGVARAYGRGELLPTPNASDGTDGGTHPDGRDGHSRQLIDYALLHNSNRWGKYEPAIRHWEQLTRPAPSPTEPNRNGNLRLSAAFSEWMMGWPDGWCTDVPGISRNDMLRIIGNGVCPQQAVVALEWLLGVVAESLGVTA